MRPEFPSVSNGGNRSGWFSRRISRLCDSSRYDDEHFALFTIRYGRKREIPG